jgi:hypothetical protein
VVVGLVHTRQLTTAQPLRRAWCGKVFVRVEGLAAKWAEMHDGKLGRTVQGPHQPLVRSPVRITLCPAGGSRRTSTPARYRYLVLSTVQIVSKTFAVHVNAQKQVTRWHGVICACRCELH